jgi:predicted regulator of Ras-like GTPase activity (Roadblock/LC7/MglB family)
MNVVMTRKDLEKINLCLRNMLSASLADAVFLVDRSGHLISHHGSTPDPDIDILALAALTAANFGATAEIAQLLGEEEFSILFHKGTSESVYFSAIGENAILVTLFDDKTTLGLIRLKVGQMIDELSRIVSPLFQRERRPFGDSIQPAVQEG